MPVTYVLSNGSVLLGFLDILDFESRFDRLPGLQAEIDNANFARTARLGRLLECLIDHRAVGVGVVYAEDRYRLVVLGKLIDEIARRAGRKSLRRYQRAVVALGPAYRL